MSEKTNSASQPKSIDTLIGAGVRVEADVDCTGVLRVQGEILGNVSCDKHPNGTLIVDSAGSVTGNVSATHVSVRGHIVGPVRSQQSIEVHEGGSLVGDVTFREIAIHAGGVVDGMLTPLPGSDKSDATPAPRGEAAAGHESAGNTGGKRKLAAAAVVLAIAGAGAWLNRNSGLLSPSGEAASRPDAGADNAAVMHPASAAVSEQGAPKPSEPEPAPLAVSQAVVAPPEPAETPPSAAEHGQDKVISVKGINPSRPAGVFLLISNEPSVLYRKKRGEPGEGARIVVPAGEKSSVAVASDELIRVAQGRDVVILFQGAKVPRNVIESGDWIGFVAR